MNESEKLMILSNNFKRLIDMVNNGFTGIPNFSDEFISENNISSIETFEETKKRLEQEFHVLMLGGINNDIKPIETYYKEPTTPVRGFEKFYFAFTEGHDAIMMREVHTIIEICAYNIGDARRMINENVYFKTKDIKHLDEFYGFSLNKRANNRVDEYGDYDIHTRRHLPTALEYEKKILKEMNDMPIKVNDTEIDS